MKKVFSACPRNFLVLFLGFLIIFSNGNIARAEEGQSDSANDAGTTGFIYNIHFPDNQMDTELGYYKLKMNPGQNQTVTISIKNPGSEPITVGISLNGAKTNANGVIEYGEANIENDKSLKFAFEDYVTAPKKVELAPGESKNLDIQIQMPDTQFDGMITGGIQMMREGQGENNSESKGSQVVNTYAYIVGMILQVTDAALTPNLELNDVYAGQSNSQNAIFVNFSNVIASFLEEMTIDVQVHTKDSSSIIYDRKQSGMRMAPNTFINFPISMNGERMVAGKYIADILVTSKDQQWEWSQEFEITAEQAAEFNARDVNLVQEKGMNWKLVAMIVGGALLVFLAIFIGIRTFKKNQGKKRKKSNGIARRKKRPAARQQH